MARIRTNKNICLYCFGDLDSERVCMSCHHKADDTPSPPHHLPQRTVLGAQNRYLIGKALGEGGFGITYLAWDLQQGIKVAVKEYFPSGYVTRVAGNNQVIINSKQNQAASNRGLKRFVEEARALAKIKNLAGVVNVRDFFSANGTAYIVMEFLDGVSLKKYLQRKGGKITTDEILTIIRPVMDSLTQVHKLGLIHRDISPDNILITKYNEVKLIDFGAAKYSNPDGRSLSIVLKQGFAPPEQYDTHGEQGPWTDVYALGVTIYFAITGVLPPESIRVMMGKEAIKRPSELGIAIDPGVENALMKSLAVDKKKRFQDVQSMINGLYNPRAPRRTVSSVTSAQPVSAPKKSVIPRTAAAPEAVKQATPVKQPVRASVITSTRPQEPAVQIPVSAARQSTARRSPVTATRTSAGVQSAQDKSSAANRAASAADRVSAAKQSATQKATPTVRASATKPTPQRPVTASRAAEVKPAAQKSATPSPAERKGAAPTVKTTTGERSKSSVFSKLFKK